MKISDKLLNGRKATGLRSNTEMGKYPQYLPEQMPAPVAVVLLHERADELFPRRVIHDVIDPTDG